MNLADSLRLSALPRVAFVGAGGKTSAMFQLARQLAARFPVVLVTTSTHLGVEQAGLADRHLTEIPHSIDGLAGVVLVTAPGVQNRRISSPGEAGLEQLHQFAGRFNLPLLVEADGSRMLPLKAPAEYEPPIPTWVNLVVNTVGLSGLGRPLDEENVQRAAIFSQLSLLPPGQPVTVEALARVLAHPQGGLKNIPASARRVALLNQADTPDRQAAARRLSTLLLWAYDAVLSASIRPPAPLEAGVWAAYEPVAGIILAAGQAQRMGRLKQLLEWRGKPLVAYAVQAALDAGLSPIIVVTGSQAEAVQAALAAQTFKESPSDAPVAFIGGRVQVIYNPHWQDGQGASVAAGVRALPGRSGAAVFFLADQPHAPPELARALVDRHAETLAPIIAPLIDGQRGNPVLFDVLTFPELAQLTGEAGGRALFSRYRPEWLTWVDPTAALDVDTPEDYQRLLDRDQAE